MAPPPPRRSKRLHLQALALQRLHPETQEVRRRSPRLHPEMHAGEEVGVGLPRRVRRRGRLASLTEEMLREILRRLPPLPSSLPRASAVCKRWRGVVTDPSFRLQFYAHGRKPPLLGYFHEYSSAPWLERFKLYSVLDPHERIPRPPRFHLGPGYRLIDCRHGLLLLRDIDKEEVVVCDLITRVQRRVAIPRELRHPLQHAHRGAVLCAAADHVHGGCPFKVVLVCTKSRNDGTIAGVYSSETGRWGNLVSTEAECDISRRSAVLIGHCLYWLPRYQSDDILGFDLDDNSLTLIGLPPHTDHAGYCQIIEPEDGVIGFIKSAFPHFQSWQRNVNAHGVATWVPWKTIDMSSIPGLTPHQLLGYIPWIMGYDEDTDAIYLVVRSSVYEVQLKLMQSRKLYGTINLCYWRHDYYPFKSFHTPGTTIAGELNGAEKLHDA